MIRLQIAEEGALCIGPAKSNASNRRPHDANLYAMRNIDEHSLYKIKDMQGSQHASRNTYKTVLPCSTSSLSSDGTIEPTP